MKIRRKQLTLMAWHNSKGPTPAGRSAEPLPPWLQKVAESGAKPDTTFIVDDPREGRGRKVVHAGDVVYLALDGSIHSIPLTRFKQEYDIADIQAKVPPQVKPEDPVPSPEKA